MTVFFDLVANALAVIYAVTNNYALAIIGLTLVIMLVVTPLTLKGTRSMMVMQQLQPEMKKIQTQYKDDRQKLNEELLKFYKENDISPLGGCLPLLVQMPVFIVLYQVLRGLTRRASDMGFDFGWVSGQLGTGTTPSKPPSIDRVFDPAYLNHSSKMYVNLSETNTMQAYGLDLAESASQALKSGVVHAMPYLVLIAIVAVTGFVQQRQIQGRNPNQQVNPQQQMIMKIMPVFLPVISFGLPSGLVLYFAVSNIFRVGQQWFISRSIYGIKRGDLPPPAPEPSAAPAQGFFASLKEQFAPSTGDAAVEKSTEPTTKGGSAKGGAKTTPAKGSGRGQSKAPAKSQAKAPAKSQAKAPAKKASTTAKSAGNGSSSSSGRTSGRVTPSKAAAAKAEQPTSRRGRNAAKADTASNTEAAPGAEATPPSKGGSAPAGAPPTLQPRARKNRKR